MVRFDAAVKNAAAHWGTVYGVTVDPALVHGILKRESDHGQHPNYVKNNGVVPEPGGHLSYGPMQVYDDTVRSIAPGVPATDLARNPELGVWYGVKYFAKQLQRFPGDVAAAVSAYNAGPGNAKRNASGKFPNQGYVDAVLSFWRNFMRIVVPGPVVKGQVPKPVPLGLVIAVAGVVLLGIVAGRRAA